MHQLINPDLQKRAKAYSGKKDLLHLVRILISGGYLLVFYISGVSSEIADFVIDFSFPIAIILYLLSFVPLTLFLLTVSFFDGYRIEKKFEMSTQNFGDWFIDQIKGLMLSILFGYPLLLLLFFLFVNTPKYWWCFGVCGMFIFQLFVLIIFPILILPLFFKQKPIENKDFEKEIYSLFDKTSIKIKGVYSFNLSTKTKKENALIAGLWKTRRILLADTLFKERNKNEILAVLAHEIGHQVNRDLMKLSLIDLVTSFIIFYSIHRIMILFTGFPESFLSTLALFPLFILFTGLISFPIKIIVNAYSRAQEKKADQFSIDLTQDREAFISLMAGLANTNLAVAYPKKLKILLSYSHPPIGQRIEFAKGIQSV
jgi:STE24 endopeptidase